MSSPPGQESQTQGNETPSTTPPAPVSASATPGPENDQMNIDQMEVDTNEANDPEVDTNDTNTNKDDEIDDENDSSMALPISKIKRIFKMDPDYSGASQSAVYATGVATELFVQYLAEQASVMAKMDKRKKIMYSDFSGAVENHEALHFLRDTIPKTVPLKTVLDKVNDPDANDTTVEEHVTSIDDSVEKPRPVDIKNMLPISNNVPAATEETETKRKPLINDLITSDRDTTEDATDTPDNEGMVIS